MCEIISEKVLEYSEISNKQRRCIELARKAAEQSPVRNTQFRHGCLLMKSGAIINIASNEDHFSAFADRFLNRNRFYATRHAEVNAILGISAEITKNATAFVVRVNRRGEMRNSRPCDMCMATLQFCGVNKIYYSLDNGKFGYIKI